MRETWHIFKKDVRYLRYEIAFLLALNALFVWTSTRGLMAGDISDAVEPLFAAAVAYTVARLIHSEALPGANQFWITRPYHWKSLLTAKLLFVLAFVNLPLLLAQTDILIRSGFPVISTLPGLFWTQLLVTFCVALPLLLLAAVTSGLVPFIGVLLCLGLAALCIGYFGFWTRIVIVTAPVAIEWLRDSVLVLAVAAMAPPLLYWQYKFRWSSLSRSWALSIAVCSASLFVFLPWRALFPLQSLLSKQHFDNLQVGIDQTRKFTLPTWYESSLELKIPIAVIGVPDQARAQIENFALTLETAGGRSLPLTGVSLARDPTPDKLVLRGFASLNPKRINTERDRPLKLRASFYLTVFGNARDRTITLRRKPQDVMDGVQCYAGALNQLECRSSFRWPARIVSQKGSAGGKTVLTGLISYSPFPASLQIDPIVRKSSFYYSSQPLSAERPVTLEVEEPLAWLQRSLEVPLPAR